MPLTNFPYGISSNGVPVLGGGIPATMGNYYFVDAVNGYDGNDGRSWDTAVKTVAQAYSLVATNNDDVIVLGSNSTHTLTAMLNITKSRVHFVGDVFGRIYGQGVKIYMGVTTAVANIHMVKNIGTRNTFNGIKFISADTLTQATSVVGEGGEYTIYSNCSFEGVKMTSNTYAEVLLNGDSTQFINCSFGTTAVPVVGDKVRPCVITTASGVASGVVSSKDILFKGCKFFKHAGGTTSCMVKIPAIIDFTRGFMEFEDCMFIATKLGSAPAAAVVITAALTASQILLTGSTAAFNCTLFCTKASGVISGIPTYVATATIGAPTT